MRVLFSRSVAVCVPGLFTCHLGYFIGFGFFQPVQVLCMFYSKLWKAVSCVYSPLLSLHSECLELELMVSAITRIGRRGFGTVA